MAYAMTTNNWIWSDQYQDHYYVTYNEYNCPVYHWAKQTHPDTNETRTRQDSGNLPSNVSNVFQMPVPAPQNVRAMSGFISGTPQTGWYDLLDSTYRMRTGTEAFDFFVVGKVFAMLYTEAAGETSQANPNDDAYTVVRFNELVHTNIRRFVVLEVRDGFVKACGIGTYSNRGTRKGGCRPSEHAIVYLQGTDPAFCYLQGEKDSGMIKDAIEILPVDSSIRLRSNSRIRFGKTYPIEKNVKVKDIGQVHPSHVGRLLQYWNEEEKGPRRRQ